MAPDNGDTHLLEQIQRTRAQVEAVVAAARPRKRRLLNITIVGGALAAVLTTGPAVGGQAFAARITTMFGLTSPAWQILCAAAALCSVAATVSTQLLKSHNLEERVFRGQSCRAKLEALEIGLSTGHVDIRTATTEYLKCVEEAALIESR